jgi:hypothetical protein
LPEDEFSPRGFSQLIIGNLILMRQLNITSIPSFASSYPMHILGGTPSFSAASKNKSGAGFPFFTSSEESQKYEVVCSPDVQQ